MSDGDSNELAEEKERNLYAVRRHGGSLCEQKQLGIMQPGMQVYNPSLEFLPS